MISFALRACLAGILLLIPFSMANATPITWDLFVYADNAQPVPGIGGTITFDSSNGQIQSWDIYFCAYLPNCQTISTSDDGTLTFTSRDLLTFSGPLADQLGAPINSLTLAFATPFPGPVADGIEILPGTANGSGSVYQVYYATGTVIDPILYGSLGPIASPEPRALYLVLVGLALIRLLKS